MMRPDGHFTPDYTIYKEFTFEAAHRLPHVPEGHKCARLHGHNYRVQVFVAGDELQDSGMLIDFGDVRRECREAMSCFDHRYLNELDEFADAYPTTEQLAQSATFVAGHMDDDGDTSSITLSETEESEHELCFQLRSADLSGGEAVEIRGTDNRVAFTTYTQTPSITVASSGITVAEIMAVLAGKGQQYPVRLPPRAHVESTTIDAFFGTPPIPPEESRLIGAVYSMSPSRIG